MEDSCGAANAHICQACPNRTKRFPTVAAKVIDRPVSQPTIAVVVAGVETEIKIANPPEPWKRTTETGVTTTSETKDGKIYQRKIYPYDLYHLDRAQNYGRETESQQWRVHLPHNETHNIAVTASTFVDDKTLMSCLANRGVYAPNFLELKTYMSAYIQELQRLNPTSAQHNHLGWIEDYTKFVLPSKIIQPDGSEVPAQLAKVASTAKLYIAQKGTLQRS